LNFIKRQVLQKRKKKKGYCILLYLVTDHTTDSWLKVFITMYVVQLLFHFLKCCIACYVIYKQAYLDH